MILQSRLVTEGKRWSFYNLHKSFDVISNCNHNNPHSSTLFSMTLDNLSIPTTFAICWSQLTVTGSDYCYSPLNALVGDVRGLKHSEFIVIANQQVPFMKIRRQLSAEFIQTFSGT